METLSHKLMTHQPLRLDGGMGTAIQQRGYEKYPFLDCINIVDPNVVVEIHTAFINAGVDCLVTNTFGSNGRRTPPEWNVELLNKTAVKLARQAIEKRPVYVLGSIGPLGQGGELADVYDAYRPQIDALLASDVDGLLIETITHYSEARLAIQYAQHVDADRPIIASMTLVPGVALPNGDSFYDVASALAQLPVSALGINCIADWEMIWKAVQYLRTEFPHIPTIVSPNAGSPIWTEDGWEYPISAEQFRSKMVDLQGMGVQLLGGCCGVTADYLKK